MISDGEDEKQRRLLFRFILLFYYISLVVVFYICWNFMSAVMFNVSRNILDESVVASGLVIVCVVMLKIGVDLESYYDKRFRDRDCVISKKSIE